MKNNALFDKLNKSTLSISTIWGFVVSLCLVWGYRLETGGSVFGGGITGFLLWMAIFVAISSVAYFLNYCLDRNRNTLLGIETTTRTKLLHTGLFAAVILVFWIPAFLAVYPGWFNYDAPWQIYMYIDGKITSHQPVLHTLLLGTIVEETHTWKVAHGDYAYNYNLSVAIYNVLQMSVCALGLGYLTGFIYDRFFIGLNKRVRFVLTSLILAFYGLYPPIVLLAMSPTKDVLFGVFYLLLVIKIIKIMDEGSKIDLSLLILTVLCVIYRQNTLYVMVLLTVPFLILLYKKHERKNFVRGVICVIAAIVVMILYEGPFYDALNVQPGSKAEFLSVPSQQLVSVYLNHGDELSSKDKDMLEQLFTVEAFEGYRPKLADKAKGNMNMDVFSANKGAYISIYMKLLMHYPREFFDSFLILNYGLWYPDATMDLYSDNDNLFFSTDYQLAIPSSKLPALQGYYMSFGSVERGATRVLLMPALSLYLAFFWFLRGCVSKKTGVILAGLGTMLIFATFLLGPCASIRYMFYIYILVPLFAANIFTGMKR